MVCVLELFSLFVVVILAGAPAYPLCLAAALRRLEGGGSQWGFPLVRPALCLPAFLLEWGEYVLVLFSLFVVVILAGAPAYPLCLAAALRRLEGGGSQWGFPLVRPAPAVVSLRSSCRVRGTVWVC